MDWLFDILVGHYSAVTSGVLGIAGSIALARGPLENTKLRWAQLQLAGLSQRIPPATIERAESALNEDARRLLNSERRWSLLGVALLLLSFAVLTAGALFEAMQPV